MVKPIIWKENLSIVCRECNVKTFYEAPFDLNVYVEDLSVFSKIHGNCKEKDREIAA